MYSSNYQPTFDLSSAASQLTNIDCLNYQRHDSIDYSRRPSYFTGLLANSSSEASYSDHEQQTPSPFNSYEDYQYHHPLDTNKRRLSTLHELPHIGYPPSDIGYSTVVQPWLTAAAAVNSNSTRSSPMIYANPAVDMYSPQTYLNSTHFDQQQQFHPLCAPMMDDNGMFRERASSSSSSSSDSSLSVSPPPSRRASKATNVKPPLKPTRSRGRRVSNSPSIAGQKVFTCKHDDCGKVFKRSEHLKRHVRSIHTLEKRKCYIYVRVSYGLCINHSTVAFECPYHSCSKRFSRSDNLNQHIRIHRHTGKDKTNNSTTSTAAVPSNNTRNGSYSNYMPTY
jgi:uncharacterized Zn-finger protein